MSNWQRLSANVPAWRQSPHLRRALRLPAMRLRLDRSSALTATVMLHLVAVALVILEAPRPAGAALPEPRLVIWIVDPAVAHDARAKPLSAAAVEPVTELVAPPTEPDDQPSLPTEEVKSALPYPGAIDGSEARMGGGHGDPFAGAAPSGHFNTAAMRAVVPARLPGPEDDPIALAALNGELAAMDLKGDIEIIVQVDADGVVTAARDLRGSLRPDTWRALLKQVVGRRLFSASEIAEPVWRLIRVGRS